MKHSYPILIVIAGLTAAIIIPMPGCSEDVPSEPPPATFEAVITNGGVCPVPVPSVVSQDLGNVTEPRDDGTFWDCVTTTYDVTKVPDECQTFDPSTDIIYPVASSRGRRSRTTLPIRSSPAGPGAPSSSASSTVRRMWPSTSAR